MPSISDGVAGAVVPFHHPPLQIRPVATPRLNVWILHRRLWGSDGGVFVLLRLLLEDLFDDGECRELEGDVAADALLDVAHDPFCYDVRDFEGIGDVHGDAGVLDGVSEV